MLGSADEGRAAKREAFALLLLRLGLGYFLLVWGVTKFLVPQQTVAIWGYFYDIEIDNALPLLFGAGEVIVALAIVFGVARPISYAVGFLIHAVTVVVISQSLFMPFVVEDGFPVNRNSSVALAALVGFAALYLLRARDRWSVDAWFLARRTGKS
ncbi:MAG: DoxX family membrane protein [Minwuiales bacterium]|nr:DoxX family membrane protein [Minwuiales bacterium]